MNHPNKAKTLLGSSSEPSSTNMNFWLSNPGVLNSITILPWAPVRQVWFSLLLIISIFHQSLLESLSLSVRFAQAKPPINH